VNHDRAITPGRRDLRTVNAPRQSAGPEIVQRFRPDSRFQVTVVATTREGTLAALKTGAALAKNIGAPITLATVQVLRSHLPLELPPFMVEFFEKKAFALVSDAGIRDRAVTIQIWFCHDQKKCLRQALGPQNLVVIGGTRRWFRREEQKLEEWLCREGYPTIFADAGAKTFTEMLPKSHRHAILHRVVKNPDKKIPAPEAN